MAAPAPVSAVVMLQHESGDRATLGRETQALAERVLERVGQQVGETSSRVIVFRNVGSMAVEASPKFLETLAKDPAVRSCRPNPAGTDLLIRPVAKPVKLDDVDR
jgi:hypothetical protein